MLLWLAALVAAGDPSAGAATGPPGTVGAWSPPFAEIPLFALRPPQTPAESKQTPPAVSMVMLPDGRVLYWGGLTGLEDCEWPVTIDAGECGQPSPTRLLDLRGGTPSWSTPTPETGGGDDLFCADQRVLVDGRVVAAGGTVYRSDPVDLAAVVPGGPGGTAELFGSRHTRYFQPATGRWTRAADMHHGRWYPTLVTLPNGTLFVASGVERLIYNTQLTNVRQTERFDPATGAWAENGPMGEASLPLFARLHLLPDGKVFYSATGQMWSPAGESADEALWNLHRVYDPALDTWSDAGIGAFGARSGAFSVLLPLTPPYDTARILVAGGTLGTTPSTYVANKLSEIITVRGGQSSSERVADLNNARWYSSGVLLPDGDVLAFSGADRDEVIEPGSESPVREAELFDGTSWHRLASGARDRTYHNSAILLPDGSVLIAGHSPINARYGAQGDATNDDGGVLANNLKDPSFEIYRPPYLFRGARPRIAFVQRGIAWGSTFVVTTPDAASVRKVVLVRLPATTHTTDADMRAVELSFTGSGGALTVTAPPNAAVAPPGYYYLFLLSDDGPGPTPSNARIVRVSGGADASGPAPAPMGG
jgi:hypothetical protein